MPSLYVDGIDEQQANETVSLRYPYLMVKNPSDALVLVLDALEPGEISICMEQDDVVYEVGSMRTSAMELLKIAGIFDVEIYIDAERSALLRNVDDIMEVLEWML